MEDYVMEHTGHPPLRITGSLVASARMGGDAKGRSRWVDVNLYRTRTGHYVIGIRYDSEWPDETPYSEFFGPTPDPHEIVHYLLRFDIRDHVGGFPEGDQFKARQERLLKSMQRKFMAATGQVLAEAAMEDSRFAVTSRV
jgi:hypothetical protein